ncbi:hypothetical protein [Marinigracilibium pacificum]|uniref:Uncharacterized protein n=1 Tax=Marinigracilibium pacificum TaxID=2729599 RepID=A0A848IYJ1_9BACT|nr:hypothetical protein [Marinigracilibium pacificum]NMM49347.1 hypothetical protein [Marinigracilibium pacificum]
MTLLQCVNKIDTRKDNEFYVFDHSDSIHYHDHIPNGSVSWMTDEIIKVDRFEGIQSDTETSDYFYNLKTNTKSYQPIFNQK